MAGFVLVGSMGVGKSSLLNQAFGARRARTHPYEACTRVVEYHAGATAYGPLTLFDTPGLAEADEACDRKYARAIRDQVDWRRVRRLLYVSPLRETRLSGEERRAIRVFTEVLGPRAWHGAWLALTFAASVERGRWAEAAERRTEQLEGCVRRSFERVLVVDNVVAGWDDDLSPVARLLVR